MPIFPLVFGIISLVTLVLTQAISGIVFNQFGTDITTVINTLLGAA